MAEAEQYGGQGDRPRSVTLINWGVFLLGLANGWRAIGLYRLSDLLLDLGASLDPRLRFILSLVWSVSFFIAGVALWRRWRIFRWLIPIQLLLYALYQLILPGMFAPSAELDDGLLAAGLLYGAAILLTTWALNRPAARIYFEDGD